MLKRGKPSKIIFEKPFKSWRKDKKMAVYVWNEKTKRPNLIHFGQKGYDHNYSYTAWKKYMQRSAGIKDKRGKLTKDNPLSANYWARKILWPGKKWKERMK